MKTQVCVNYLSIAANSNNFLALFLFSLYKSQLCGSTMS